VRTVVVTGAAKGLGRGLAEALLARGCKVAITGRNAADLEIAAETLSEVGAGRVRAVAGDVSNPADVQRAWDETAEWAGPPDVWVNNAGYALGNTRLAEMDPAELEAMTRTNVLGVLLGCRTAARGMLAAGAPGAIYNLYGAGSDGAYISGMTAYGTTKAGVRHLTECLARELAGTPVIVCGISPGLVITDGWLREHAKVPEAARPARIAKANLMADHVETVAAWMAKIILENRETGRAFKWLTPAKLRRRKATSRPRDILSRYL